MKVSSAEFTAAAATPAEIPRARFPEIAIAGRSNVGKSSLINKLTGRRKLARTSQTPGCTRGLNFYALGDRFTLVDLPGYGWARRSKQERDRWKVLVEHYLETRNVLAGVLILVDARRGAEKEELALAEYLAAAGIPYVWVLTKCDKLKRAELAAAVLELAALPDPRPAVATSAQTGGGIDQLWREIESLLDAGRAKRRHRA